MHNINRRGFAGTLLGAGFLASTKISSAAGRLREFQAGRGQLLAPEVFENSSDRDGEAVEHALYLDQGIPSTEQRYAGGDCPGPEGVRGRRSYRPEWWSNHVF